MCPPWLGCCVRLAELVSCHPICLPICLPPHLGWGAVSASLGLSPVLSPNLSSTWLCLSPWLGCCVRLAGLVSQFVSYLALPFTLVGVLCPPRWACLPICLPICLPPGFVFHLGWGAVSASLGLSPNLSPTWLCLWACLRSCLPICLASGCVSQFSFPICFSPWLGCCVRLAGLVSGLVSQFVSQFVSHLALSPHLFPT